MSLNIFNSSFCEMCKTDTGLSVLFLWRIKITTTTKSFDELKERRHDTAPKPRLMSFEEEFDFDAVFDFLNGFLNYTTHARMYHILYMCSCSFIIHIWMNVHITYYKQEKLSFEINFSWFFWQNEISDKLSTVRKMFSLCFDVELDVKA